MITAAPTPPRRRGRRITSKGTAPVCSFRRHRERRRRLHPNATTRCDARRFSRQADEPRRPGSQPSFGFGLAARGLFQPIVTIAGRIYLLLALSGLCTGASWVCYFRALQTGDAARVAPIDKLSVVLVALFGVIFLSEPLNARNWAGIGMMAVGAILVASR
jgi:drug/metabolite transporter (DMT)-like permease